MLSMCFSYDDDLAKAVELGLQPHHFSSIEAQTMFAAMIEDFMADGSLEAHVFMARHRKDGSLALMGGEAEFAKLTGEYVNTENVEFWVEEIREGYQRRNLKKVLADAGKALDDPAISVKSVASAMSNRALDSLNEQEKPQTLSASVDEVEEQLDAIISGTLKEEDLGCPTPIAAINANLGIPRPGELITIAARPGGGKSSMMRGIIRHIAENMGRALFLSREMPLDELTRVFAQETSGVSWKYVRENLAPDSHIKRFREGLAHVKKLDGNLIINDRDRTVDQITARIAASARHERKLQAVAVDYLQRYDPQQRKGETRDVAIGRFTMALKDAAVTHKLPVFLGAQLGRGSERENRQPRLSDLRESGNIEQDSDRVWFLWIPDNTPKGDPQDPNISPIIHVKLIQAKGRGDGMGTIDLAFHRKFTTFKEWKSLDI